MNKLDELEFADLGDKVQSICKNLNQLVNTPGPTRSVAKLTDEFDPRRLAETRFPMA